MTFDSMRAFIEWLEALPERPNEVILHWLDYARLRERLNPASMKQDETGFYLLVNGCKIRQPSRNPVTLDFSKESLWGASDDQA